MVNVIIVDDELCVREGLKDYFEENLDFLKICGIFDNADYAMKYLKENPDVVDVVLTDIKMTTASGVLLAQMIREYELDTIIVFLSCIKEYEYAKLAIDYNAFAYIEKPIDYNYLDEILKKIKKQLKLKSNAVKNATEDKQELLILQFLVEVYSGFFNGNEQLLSRAKSFGLGEFAVRRPCTKFSLKIEKEESKWKYGTKRKEMAILNAFRTKGIKVYDIFSVGNSIDLLAVPDDMTRPYRGEKFSEKVEKVISDALLVLDEMGVKAKIGEVTHFKDLYFLLELHRSYMQELKIENFIRAISEELLSGNFNEENKQKIEQILSDFELKNYKIDLNAFYGGSDEKNSPVSFRDTNNIKNSAIKKSLEWIHSNYNWNITLVEAAKQVMLSPVYYGRLFKTNVGISFTAYLLNFRLNKARHLLKDSMLNVREIANLVGYKDVNYFIRQFKKKYGVSPNEFKKQW